MTLYNDDEVELGVALYEERYGKALGYEEEDRLLVIDFFDATLPTIRERWFKEIGNLYLDYCRKPQTESFVEVLRRWAKEI